MRFFLHICSFQGGEDYPCQTGGGGWQAGASSSEHLYRWSQRNEERIKGKVMSLGLASQRVRCWNAQDP